MHWRTTTNIGHICQILAVLAQVTYNQKSQPYLVGGFDPSEQNNCQIRSSSPIFRVKQVETVAPNVGEIVKKQTPNKKSDPPSNYIPPNGWLTYNVFLPHLQTAQISLPQNELGIHRRVHRKGTSVYPNHQDLDQKGHLEKKPWRKLSTPIDELFCFFFFKVLIDAYCILLWCLFKLFLWIINQFWSQLLQLLCVFFFVSLSSVLIILGEPHPLQNGSWVWPPFSKRNPANPGN